MLVACCCGGVFGRGSVPDDGVGLGDVVALLVDGGVAVGVPDSSEAWKRPTLVSQDMMMSFCGRLLSMRYRVAGRVAGNGPTYQGGCGTA